MAANTKDKCTAVAGATWVAATAGWCSNAFYTDSASCTANKYTWTDGWCKTADAQAACTGGTGDGAKTWRLNGTQASCQVAGATWTFARCSVEGFCNKGTCTDSKYTNEVDCEAAGAIWYAIKSKAVCDSVGGQFAYATDIIRCDDAGGRWNSNIPNRGQIITSVCMECHRQETSGLPNTNGSLQRREVHDAGRVRRGGRDLDGQRERPAAHGRPVPQHGRLPEPPAQQPVPQQPARQVQREVERDRDGQVRRIRGLEVQEHVHDGRPRPPTRGTAAPGATRSTRASSPARSPSAPTVPSATTSQEPRARSSTRRDPARRSRRWKRSRWRPASRCHMPSGVHLFRINTDKDYSTYPDAAGDGRRTPRRTPPPDGAYTNAVWVDLDAACGQCHGGGAANVKTTGTVAAGSASLTVASATGLAVGQKIRVAGAGAYYYDDIGQSGKNTDFDTYVKAIAGNVVTLAGTATKGVTNAAVTQNVDDERRQLPDQGGPRRPGEGDAQRRARGEVHGDAGSQRADGRRRRLRLQVQRQARELRSLRLELGRQLRARLHRLGHARLCRSGHVHRDPDGP